MLSSGERRLLLIAIALVAYGLLRLGSDDGAGDPDRSIASTNDTTQPAADTARVLPMAKVPTSADSSKDGDIARGAVESTQSPAPTLGAITRLHVRAPADVRTGDVFEARVDLEANGGLRELAFALTYDKTRLSLAGWSEGNFARQGGLASELTAQEPSDGNILVNFGIRNGLWVAGAGSVVLLRFEALRAGNSRIGLQDITAVDRSRSRGSRVTVEEAAVRIH
jgi:hypothetical protein